MKSFIEQSQVTTWAENRFKKFYNQGEIKKRWGPMRL